VSVKSGQVINAGVPGYCPLLSYLQFRHGLGALQADVVVLNFDMSDVADDYRYRRHTRTDGDEPLACAHPDLGSARPSDGEAWHEQFLVTAWGRRQLARLPAGPSEPSDRRDIASPEGRYAWLRDDPPDWSIYIGQALAPIDSLNLLVHRAGADLVVATYPAPWQVSTETSGGEGVRAAAGVPDGTVYRSRGPFDLLAAWTAERNIPFCDASPAFQQAEHGERLYLRNAPRFSPAGHELYARELAAFLVQHVRGIWSDEPWESPSGPLPPRHALSEPR
jgi:hypothetical protein